ncbi:thioredoxin [bacterium]|jgi:thioredoxin 1|nr:thioredoxin [bacterium]MBT4251402.1 thioredoxin [bacterium]MBT4598138.1 thioredoxin [bacterium]MBT6754353.1 thioredoxin [bacterium]MBT7037276.1 thioredoxin [bacterium]
MALEFNDANFEEEVLKSDKPVLVDFWAPWCGPCQMMGPVIDETAKEVEETAKVGKLNVDENSETAQKYGVMSIPTLIIFKGGKNVKQLVGAQSKEVLVEEMKKA